MTEFKKCGLKEHSYSIINLLKKINVSTFTGYFRWRNKVNVSVDSTCTLDRWI